MNTLMDAMMNSNRSTPMTPASEGAPSTSLFRSVWTALGDSRARPVLAAVLLVGVAVAGAPPLEAQVGAGSAPAQMRHFWHVFAAYAIAWLLLFGWAVSIARRIRRVEEKLDRDR